MKKEKVYDTLRKYITEVSPYAAEALIKNDLNFQNIHMIDLGVNSIDYLEIIQMTLDQLEAHLSINSFTNVNKVSDIAHLICKNCEI